MRKLLASAGVITAIAAALPTAVPAQAAVDQCSTGHICVWSEPAFNGKFKEVQGSLGQCFKPQANWPGGTTSRIASLSNKYRFQVQAYDNDSCSGQPYGIVKPDQGAEKISDRLKSLRVTPVCNPGQVCFYEKENYSGKAWGMTPKWGSICYNAKAEGAEAPHAAYNMLGGKVTLWFTNGLCLRSKYDLPDGEFAAFDDPIHQVMR
ncbi:peptidase inhibitor family I36 protein [Streptomyces sp. WMMB303]|uniref:peptidase inhibitor family I36 protein n=1 Tax=Streptomyces sp. WMMB303 TaxID=3034154 RepID=UPI0023EC5A33|nr:peptidase inhibitor family I36 protein [Streptomyces sp. WMMB303]MDF4250374.1 peptidase inhibitor family I36 protein [Streptomyces sp. WMMB303]